jgi:hypothetical protein
MQFELLDIISKIVEMTKRVPRVETYLKLSTDLYIWGVDETDVLLLNTKKRLKAIVDDNY